MGVDDGPIGLVQGPLPFEHPVGDAYLAHVVHEPGQVGELHLVLAQPHVAGQFGGPLSHGSRVPGGVVVLGVEGVDQSGHGLHGQALVAQGQAAVLADLVEEAGVGPEGEDEPQHRQEEQEEGDYGVGAVEDPDQAEAYGEEEELIGKKWL